MSDRTKQNMGPRPATRPEDYLGGVALPVKDVLRGVRYGLRSVRDTAASLQSKLPGPLGTLGAATIEHVDWLATKVDRNSSHVVRRYLDPLIMRDADRAVFSKLITLPNAPVLFAKAVYDHLKPSVAYIARTLDLDEHVFISEMLAAVAYQRVAATLNDVDDVEKAAVLLTSMLETGVIRTATSQSAAESTDPATRRLAKMACFGIVLWLAVKADEEDADEEGLLFTCCDLAMALDAEIDAADDDEAALAGLLRHYVGMV